MNTESQNIVNYIGREVPRKILTRKLCTRKNPHYAKLLHENIRHAKSPHARTTAKLVFLEYIVLDRFLCRIHIKISTKISNMPFITFSPPSDHPPPSGTWLSPIRNHGTHPLWCRIILTTDSTFPHLSRSYSPSILPSLSTRTTFSMILSGSFRLHSHTTSRALKSHSLFSHSIQSLLMHRKTRSLFAYLPASLISAHQHLHYLTFLSVRSSFVLIHTFFVLRVTSCHVFRVTSCLSDTPIYTDDPC